MSLRANTLAQKRRRFELGRLAFRGFEWELPLSVIQGERPPGPRAKARSTAPARFISPATHSFSASKNIRPNGTSA
jgi:hypothetical protein